MPSPLAIRWETLYDRFNRSRLKEFEGSMDPHEAKDWLHSTRTILKVMKLRDREKILCATFMLRRKTRYWWEIVKERTNVSLMTWTEFN